MMETGRLYIKPQFPASRSLIFLESTPAVTQSQLVGAGILLAFALAAALARRDGVGFASAAALLGAAGVAAVAGGGMFGWLVDGEGFSSVGALLGAIGAVAGHRRVFGARETARILDVVTPGGFGALAMARLGCLFEGCHFGARTSMAWAVRYEAPHPVWFHHVTQQVVDRGATTSAPVHPYPLYIVVPMAFMLLAACLVPGGYGRRAVLVVFGYALVRVVAEFFREPTTAVGLGVLSPGSVAGFALAALTITYWWKDVRGAFQGGYDTR